jgi:hypothetical protein
MDDYLVTWEGNSYGESPREAAEAAWEMMQAPDSYPPILTVRNLRTGEEEDIDLAGEEEDEDEG